MADFLPTTCQAVPNQKILKIFRPWKQGLFCFQRLANYLPKYFGNAASLE
jgi:hypothetical protein